MNYLKRELFELYETVLAILAWYLYPKKILAGVLQEDSIEYSVRHFKNSFALLIVITLLISAVTVSGEVEADKRPGELLLIYIQHGFVTALLLAGITYFIFRVSSKVNVFIGIFILSFWIPLWIYSIYQAVFWVHFAVPLDSFFNFFERLDQIGHFILPLLFLWSHSVVVSIYLIRGSLELGLIQAIILGLLPSVLSIVLLDYSDIFSTNVDFLYSLIGF